jgi:hypothetical protein
VRTGRTKFAGYAGNGGGASGSGNRAMIGDVYPVADGVDGVIYNARLASSSLTT